jgi:hypothetical protein
MLIFRELTTFFGLFSVTELTMGRWCELVMSDITTAT